LALSIFASLLPAAAEQPGSDASRNNPLAVLPLSQLEQTRQRPLFAPSRRPLALPSVLARGRPAVAPLAPPSLVLVGVVSDAKGPRAIVRPSPTEKTRYLQIGDDIAGWNVVEIEPRRLLLQRDSRSSAFSLFESMSRTAKPNPRGN
jgi:hypothetical protein